MTMRRTPLAAALLLFVALCARAEGVRVLLRCPAEETDETRAKIEESGRIVAELLRPPIQPERYRKIEETAAVERFSASAWLEDLSPEARYAGVRRLETLWGKGAVRIVDDGSGAMPSPTPPLRQEAAAFLHALRLSEAREVGAVLTGVVRQDGLVLFDQGALRAGVEFRAAPDGSAAAASPALRSAPPRFGGLRIDAIPVPGERVLPKGPYEDIVQAEAKAAGIDPAVLRALLSAKGGLSASPARASGRAYGLLLITPHAADSVGLSGQDLRDPEVNLRAGALLLKNLLDRYHGDVHRALAAYQMGTGAVTRSGGIPNDPALKSFLAAYERAYRQGPEKPAVEPVSPPRAAGARQAVEAARERKDPRPAVGKDPIARYRKMIDVVAKRRKVDADLIEAIMRAENPWGDPMRVSPRGAVGLMQLMPATAEQYEVDPNNPEQSVDGAARHLRWLLEYFDGNKVLAVAAYNAGHVPVQKHGRIPRFGETRKYVPKVSGYLEQISGEGLPYAEYMPASAATGKAVRRKP